MGHPGGAEQEPHPLRSARAQRRHKKRGRLGRRDRTDRQCTEHASATRLERREGFDHPAQVQPEAEESSVTATSACSLRQVTARRIALPWPTWCCGDCFFFIGR
ncbi:MAG: hypothetical protein [Podoviridae sp. ctdb7]|nr:MAG: hypothetical protein [Podoviridae sp. ctdb7]